MPKISIDKLIAGEVLGIDVQDLNGRMLLKSGTIIEEKHLKVLRTWGVMSVDIDSDDAIDSSETEIKLSDFPPEIIMAINSEIEGRFSGVDVTHPVMAALVDVVQNDLIHQHLIEVNDG